MTNITWAESEHEYPNGAAWPDGLHTYPTIHSARENSAYAFPEQAYLYCVQDGRVLGSCELYVEEVRDRYEVVSAHRVKAGHRRMIASRVSGDVYASYLEYVILEHIRQANEYIGDVS